MRTLEQLHLELEAGVTLHLRHVRCLQGVRRVTCLTPRRHPAEAHLLLERFRLSGGALDGIHVTP